LAELGFGEMTQRHEWPPRRSPWVLDNGAFGDWKAGRDFDDAEFRSACEWACAQAPPARPLWAVCPDRVATGTESLAFSLAWLDTYASAFPDLSWYLAVQDGMVEADVVPVSSRFAGLFVGGTLPWKIRTGAEWVVTARRLGMPCHIGRVGTPRRVAWAHRIGADSIDSCLPLWSAQKLDAFVAAVGATGPQASMPW
jgi:hypothetical protein